MPTDPIQFKRENDVITITMSVENYDRVLMTLGFTAGCVKNAGDEPAFWSIIRLCNDLNAGNPQYTPYEIPEEHAE